MWQTDFTHQLGYVNSNGYVYKGSPGNDRSSVVGYVDVSGRVGTGGMVEPRVFISQPPLNSEDLICATAIQNRVLR
jgi:hypothetical protein